MTSLPPHEIPFASHLHGFSVSGAGHKLNMYLKYKITTKT